ncbi:hypothetical protein RvY_00282 [Ramazzottius varieornatus]|uniref:Uncharacterized protein n=1 Tax=Ramazzottius varieornatus TaxID=947166 RepID=A0A1D1UCQ8_RAMVA|nr:hypothetical protein RvY_00282 [Ramazzottius varieornatus]
MNSLQTGSTQVRATDTKMNSSTCAQQSADTLHTGSTHVHAATCKLNTNEYSCLLSHRSVQVESFDFSSDSTLAMLLLHTERGQMQQRRDT